MCGLWKVEAPERSPRSEAAGANQHKAVFARSVALAYGKRQSLCWGAGSLPDNRLL